MILYKDFTAVIPAAGKGVGLIKIKISYYTKLRKTIFENVLDKIKSFSNNIVIIVSKDNIYKIKNMYLIKNINKLSLFYYKEIQMVWVMQ